MQNDNSSVNTIILVIIVMLVVGGLVFFFRGGLNTDNENNGETNIDVTLPNPIPEGTGDTQNSQ